MLKKATFTIFVTFMIFILVSCLTTPINNYYRSEDIFLRGKETFLKIEVFVVIGNCKDGNQCVTVFEKLLSTGSGFVVGSYDGGSYVATADHLCHDRDFENIRIDPIYTILGEKIEVILIGVLSNYERYELKIAKQERKTDLCLLKADRLVGVEPLRISSRIPRQGEEVLNVSAPHAIFHKNAPIMVKGIYNGMDLDGNFSVFSLEIRDGSSGSAILDRNGKVVGIVSMRRTDVEYIVYSPPLASMIQFYR